MVAQPSAVPAIAEDGADGILARLQQRGDIERLIGETVAVTRPARREHFVAGALAIDLDLVDAQRSDVEARAAHLACQRKVSAQHWRGLRGAQVFVPIRTDEARRPILRRQQAHLDFGCIAPLGGVTILAPHAHAHLAATTRGKWRKGPRHQHRIRGFNLSRRDWRAAVIADLLNFVGGLSPIWAFGHGTPREARTRDAYPQRH